MSQAQKEMFREQELNEIGKAIPKTDGECLSDIQTSRQSKASRAN